MTYSRRTVALALTLTACVLLIGCSQAGPRPEGTVPVSGRVFLDANANGCYDEGEKGLGNVAVTDGVRFARTGRDGRSVSTPGSTRWSDRPASRSCR